MFKRRCPKIFYISLVAAVFWNIMFAISLSSTSVAQPIDTSSLSAEQIARILAEVPEFGYNQLAVSPNGEWIVYYLTKRSFKTNEQIQEIMLQRLPRVAGEMLPEPVRLPTEAKSIQWLPDGSGLTMIVPGESGDSKRLVKYNAVTGQIQPILSEQPTTGKIGANADTIGGNYKWSNSGRYIAFTAAFTSPGKLDPAKGIAVSEWRRPSLTSLFVVDTATRSRSRITPDSLAVTDFAWSPDESKLAFSVKEFPEKAFYLGTDLMVVDRTGEGLRSLIKRPGRDHSPMWSPDGQWIAFTSQMGDLSYTFSSELPAVVSASGGPANMFKSDGPVPSVSWLSSNGWMGWAKDSSAFYYSTPWQMTRRFVRADIASLRTLLLPTPKTDVSAITHSYSLSDDRKWMAYIQESTSIPPELFIVALDERGNPSGVSRQLTQLNPTFSLRTSVRTELLEWPSPDGRFTIHSLLILPASRGRNGQAPSKLPTLLYFTGGPSMVSPGYARDGMHGSLIALAARGYAVLVPNTRGRAGYGDTFERGIRDGKTNTRLPFEDAMAGIDLLIKRGIADPTRLGVFGHSYGGLLTQYTITRTDKFKAAIINEGITNDLQLQTLFDYTDFMWLLNRDLVGIHDPFDHKERERMIADTPGLNVNRVKTPTMLLYGAAHTNAEKTGVPFFNGLRRFNVPSVLFVYDERHVFYRPAAIVDQLTRTGEWLDHWVRGIPFPDATRAAEYRAWQDGGLHGSK